MREALIRRSLGERALCISVNPLCVTQETVSLPIQRRRLQILASSLIPAKLKGLAMRVAFELNRFALEEGEFERHDVTSTNTFRTMKDVSDNRHALEMSATYANALQSIRSTGRYVHKAYSIQSSSEVTECIRACYLDIITSMERDGYLPHKSSTFATGEIGTAMIDRDGSLLKGPGATHRMAAARIAGVSTGFPFRIIGAHREWLERKSIRGIRDIDKLAAAIREVEHQHQRQFSPMHRELA